MLIYFRISFIDKKYRMKRLKNSLAIEKDKFGVTNDYLVSSNVYNIYYIVCIMYNI